MLGISDIILQKACCYDVTTSFDSSIQFVSSEIPAAIPYKLIRDVLFIKVSLFSLNSLTELKLIKNSYTSYDYFFINNRLLFSGNFCNLIIPKQGIEMQFFS